MKVGDAPVLPERSLLPSKSGEPHLRLQAIAVAAVSTGLAAMILGRRGMLYVSFIFFRKPTDGISKLFILSPSLRPSGLK
jgi:hypothetical protein